MSQRIYSSDLHVALSNRSNPLIPTADLAHWRASKQSGLYYVTREYLRPHYRQERLIFCSPKANLNPAKELQRSSHISIPIRRSPRHRATPPPDSPLEVEPQLAAETPKHVFFRGLTRSSKTVRLGSTASISKTNSLYRSHVFGPARSAISGVCELCYSSHAE